MMRLYLLRHGKAEDANRRTDFSRRLTPEGAAKMQEAARGMAALKIAPQTIWSSPLPRAHETAAIAAKALGDVPVEIAGALSPGMTPEALARLVEAKAPDSPLMLVGHNPDFEDLVSWLIAPDGRASIELKKGALCAINCDPPLHCGGGSLGFLWTAGQLTRLG